MRAAPLLLLAAACSQGGAPAPDAAPPPADALPLATTSTSPELVHRTLYVMGSQVTITVYTTERARALAAIEEALAEFERLDRLLSTWKEESEISRINRAAGERAVPISGEVLSLLLRARGLSELTRGRFDVTFAAMSGLWRFDHDQDNTVPKPAEIAARVRLIDYRQLVLDPEALTALLRKKGMKVGLGGIGKGYGVDRAVALLRGRGFTSFMVQAGGDLYVAGTKRERPWRVGIRDPRGPPDRYFAATEITDATFSTSGDYERSFVANGKRYHHIIDPRTGMPATACRSVTIMAPDATLAEGLSKGVFILGPKEGLALIEATPGAGAVIVDKDNRVHVSARLEGKLKILLPPTPGI